MEKKVLSVCFADISGFHKYLSWFGPEKTYALLQRVFKEAGYYIYANNGRIIKYIGDSILFVFENPADAIKAANLISTIEVSDTGTMQINISIATGEVCLCKIGHPDFLLDDIIGKAVNEAAILLRQAGKSPDSIIICGETKKALE